MKTVASRQVRVLIIRNAYRHDFGGGERMPVNLAKLLTENGISTTVISRSPTLLDYAKSQKVHHMKGWWWPAQNWSGFRVIFFPIYLLWQLALIIWYLQLIARLQVDVVHPQSKDDFISATVAAKLLGKKVIWSDHADLKYVYLNTSVWYKNPIGKLVLICSHLASTIILTSQNDKKQIEESLGRKLENKYKVIYNGIFDRPDLVSKKHSGKKIIFAATSRLVTAKGIGELIQAFKTVEKQVPAELWIFGEGPEEKKFRQLAGNSNSIKFNGFPSDTLEQVAKVDIFVHPSYMEGFSISLLEAAMLGKPIIACDVGGNPELIKNSKSGLLIPPRDTDSLAGAMLKLAKDSDLCRRLGEQARADYQAYYRLDDIVKSIYIPLYRSLKPLRILFDANPLAAGNKSGVGHYTYFLVQSLADAYPDSAQLTGHFYNFLGTKNPDLPSGINITYRQSRFWPGKATNLLRRFGIELPLELLARRRADILLFPNFICQPSLFGRPIVTAIHDLSFLDYPQFVSERNLSDLRRFVPESINRSDLIITISNFTRKRIKQAYNVPGDRLIVTPIPPLKANKLPRKEAAELVRKLGVKGSFILFVGNLEPRKNLLNFVNAYAGLSSELRQEFSLVLAGGAGWKNQELLNRLKALKASGYSINTPGYVSDNQKAALYQQSTVVVLPSYYEGFGMPVLEAYSYGIAMAVSDIEVLREVAENGAVYFQPDNLGSIRDSLAELLQDKKLQEKLVKAQPSILAKYSWPETANNLFDRFNELR